MKIKAYQPLVALLFVSGILQAQTIVPPPGVIVEGYSIVEGDSTVEGNANVQGTTLLNGTLTVQPGAAVTPLSPNANNTGAINPMTGDVGPTTTTVRTKIGEAAGNFDDLTGGGAVIETNGNTTLNSSTGNNVAVEFSRITEFEVNNADQPMPGEPVPMTQVFYIATETAPGVFTQIPGTPTFASEGDMNTYITTTPVTDPVFAPAATLTPLPDTGGNLVVGGNASVAGQTTTNGIDNSGEKITGVADGMADDDAATVGQVGDVQDALDQEITDRTDADDALDDRIDQEITDRTDADDALDDRIDQEITDRTDADDALDDRIDQEITDRTDADDALDDRIDQEITDRTDADDALGVRIDDEEAARIAKDMELMDADAALGVRIDDEEQARQDGDDALGVRIDDEEQARQDGDNALGVRIDDEATTRANKDMQLMDEDASIRTDFAAADTTERNARIAADNAEANTRAAADTALGGRINDEIQDRIDAVANEANIRSNADLALGNRITNETFRVNGEINRLDGRINTETNARIAGDARLQSQINENTRGIAMVAAMTNTRVEAGKTHGIDFNLAQYQSETGFAFGYANRINENLQIHGAIASTTDFDESVVRVGVAYQW